LALGINHVQSQAMVPPLEESPGFTKSWLMDMPIWKLTEHLKKGQGGLPLSDGTATIQVWLHDLVPDTHLWSKGVLPP